jgi:hypothetical protein
MSVILNIDDLIDLGHELGLDVDKDVTALEKAATRIAKKISKKLDVVLHEEASYDIAGICASFSARHAHHICPPQLQAKDPDGDFEFKGPK